MMRLDRLAAMVGLLSADGAGPLADEAAARWGGGRSQHVRTSAAAVFAVAGGYLRLTSTADRSLQHAQRVAEASVALAAAGAPVVAARPSLQGRLVEVLTDAGPGLGTVHATLVDRAPGPVRELADLEPPQVEQWGAGLARLHAAGASLVGWSTADWLRSVVESVTDHQMSDAVGGWALTCRAELGPPTCVIHGDAQPDNAGWGEAGPVFFDLDELASAWPVVDLVLAVRDVQPLDALSTSPTATGPGRALIAGYRSVGGVSAAELAMAPLLQRLAAAATYGSLLRALDHPALPDADPAWLAALRARLREVAERLRTALLAAS